MSSYIKKAVNGIGTTLMFSFLAALIAYAIRVYLANYFTTEEFGILYSVLNLVIICLFIRDLGLGESLIKHIAEYKVHEKFSTK